MADDIKRRDTTITKICDNCGKGYHPRQGYQGAARFCCQECFRLYQSKGRTTVASEPTKSPTYEVYKPTPMLPPRGR